jgi:hypothetical protein
MLVNDLTLTEYRDAPRELKAITAITAEDLLRRGLIATASTVEIFDMDEHEANMRIVLPTEKAPTQFDRTTETWPSLRAQRIYTEENPPKLISMGPQAGAPPNPPSPPADAQTREAIRRIRSMSMEELTAVGEEALQQLVKLGVMEVVPGEFENGNQIYKLTPFGLRRKEDPGWPSGNAQLEEAVDILVLRGEIEITGYEGDKPVYGATELGLQQSAEWTGRPIEELRALPELNRRAEVLWPSLRWDRRTMKRPKGD